jgi:uncharacterized protein YaiE (UPF0345 family)
LNRASDRLKAALAVAAAAAVLLASGSVAAGRRSAGGSKSGSLFVPDKGSFKVLVNGQQIGKEDFEISPNGGNWSAKGSSEINTSDGMTKVSGSLELRADGTPVSYEWSTQGAKKAGATINFNGATATIDLRLDGRRPFTQQFTFQSPQIAVLDNNLYYQYAVLARLYDRDKKGAQTFSVLVPQELTPGTLTVESLGDQNAGNGKKMEELVVKTEDLEVDLFLDGGKLVRIVAPSSNAEIDRL